jgi:hypothetical protein
MPLRTSKHQVLADAGITLFIVLTLVSIAFPWWLGDKLLSEHEKTCLKSNLYLLESGSLGPERNCG